MLDFIPNLPWLLLLLSVLTAAGLLGFQWHRNSRTQKQHLDALLAQEQRYEAQLEAFRRQHTETMLAQQDEHQAILRRREREAEKQSERAVFPLLRDLLPALDALEQAQQSTLHPETSPHDLAQGIGLLQHTFLQAFAQHEIHPIQPTRGTLFDPNAHESIGLIDDPTLPPNTIAQTLRTGWRVRDALLRPATVQTTHSTVQTTHSTVQTTHPTAQTTHPTVQTTEYIEHTNHTSSQSAQPNEQITHPNEDLGT